MQGVGIYVKKETEDVYVVVNEGNIAEENLVCLLPYVLGIKVGEPVQLLQECEQNHPLVLLGFNSGLNSR